MAQPLAARHAMQLRCSAHLLKNSTSHRDACRAHIHWCSTAVCECTPTCLLAVLAVVQPPHWRFKVMHATRELTRDGCHACAALICSRSAAARAACAGFLSQEWIQRLRDTTDKFVQLSRGYTRDTVLPLGRCAEADPLAGETSDAHHIVVIRHVCKPLTSAVDVHLSSAIRLRQPFAYRRRARGKFVFCRDLSAPCAHLRTHLS
jgi:hypothetical protein